MLRQDVLDELWLFDNAVESEARFRFAIDHGGPWDDTERAELVTQLARSLGLQGRFDEGAELLIGIDGGEPVVGVRVLLESGRLMNGSGHPEPAAGLFRRAATIAARADLLFLRVDSLHMLAIVDPDGTEDWTAQAAELAEASPDARVRRWLVSLHSNLGWYRLEASDPAGALESFTEASRWADLVGTDDQRTWAAEAIAECTAVLESESE